MQHKLEFVLFQLLKWLVLSLPLRSAQRLGYYFGNVAFHLASNRRKIALENLRHAFPEKSDAERIAIAKGAFQNYGIAISSASDFSGNAWRRFSRAMLRRFEAR
jgi:KDO2-lipid IV(A) lauroyltransferase